MKYVLGFAAIIVLVLGTAYLLARFAARTLGASYDRFCKAADDTPWQKLAMGAAIVAFLGTMTWLGIVGTLAVASTLMKGPLINPTDEWLYLLIIVFTTQSSWVGVAVTYGVLKRKHTDPEVIRAETERERIRTSAPGFQPAPDDGR